MSIILLRQELPVLFVVIYIVFIFRECEFLFM